MQEFYSAIERIAIFFVPLMLGIVCHEVAHGFVAYLQGDPTAKNLGRLNLNPIKHLDPMGSLMFVLTAIIAPFVIGWAKPVPVDPRYFKNPRKGMVLVAIAGPATNFILAILFALLLRVFVMLAVGVEPDSMLAKVLLPLILIGAAGVVVNIVLGLFNLIPLPPLDGSNIIAGMLPPRLAYAYMRFGRWGMLVIILLLAFGVLGHVLGPILFGMLQFFVNVFGLPPQAFQLLMRL